MTAVDTNVLVRFLVKDDAKQAQRAKETLEQGALFIPKTVLLETEWVLRYTYEFDRVAVCDALKKVCGLAQAIVEDAATVMRALEWHANGFDFADALHLASSQGRGVQQFASFDRLLAKKAKQLDAPVVIQL
jgi:predicted nucleic-acid-binding protein